MQYLLHSGAAFALVLSAHSVAQQQPVSFAGGPSGFKLPPFIDRPIKAAGGSDVEFLFLGVDGKITGTNFQTWFNIPDLSLRTIDIAKGKSFGIAVLEDGSVRVWSDTSPAPASVLAIPSDVGFATKVAAAQDQVCVLRQDGTVRCWGEPGQGALVGFQQVTNAIGVSIGLSHGAAVRTDGTVQCWGDNSRGQCNVPQGLSGVIQAVATGQLCCGVFTAALKSDGQVVIWGSGSYPTAPIPEPVSSLAISWSSMNFSRVIAGNRVYCLAAGQNQSGDCIEGAAITNAESAATSALSSAVIRQDGSVSKLVPPANQLYYDWVVPAHVGGRPTSIYASETSQLAITDATTGAVSGTDSALFRTTVVPKGVAFSSLALTNSFCAGITSTGSVVTWRSSGAPPSVPAGLPAARKLEAGESHLLILLETGGVAAATWPGGNSFGQSDVPGDLPPSVDIMAGGDVSGALSAAGSIRVWGSNTNGHASVPAGTFQSASFSAAHALAIRTDGIVVAWGSNSNGQRNVPADLGPCTAVAAGYRHSMALRTDGTVRVWGYNPNNSLALPTTERFRAIAAGGDRSFGLRAGLDCDANGIDDDAQIAANPALDCNANGKLDSCEATDTAGAIRNWINSAGGNFATCSNWNLVPPATTDPTRFAVAAAYPVSFTANRTTKSASFTSGNVTLQLGSRTYTQSAINPLDSFVRVGGASGASLTVLSGTVTAPYAKVGELAGDTGTLNIGSGGRLIATTDLCVGCAGTGTMNITSGGRVTTSEATVGASIGGSGTVSLSGSLSKWIGNLGIDVRRGTLNIASPASVDVPNVPLVVFQGGTVRGTGTVNGDIANFGDGSDGTCGLEPGAGTAGNLVGTFNLLGNYGQIPADPKLGNNSGSLGIDVVGGAGGATADLLAVQGQASLGGGLFVRIPQGDPGNFTNLPILTAALLDPARSAFDVAYLPALPDGRFIRVSTVGALAGAVISLSTDTLAGILGFGGANGTFVAGQPLAAASGDFDGDTDTDVAVTVAGATTTSNGALLVLFNDGQGGLSGVLQIPLGVDPVAIAAGRLRDNGPVDLAVANRGSDNIQLLYNNGNGVFTTGSVVSTGPGSQPSSIALANVFATVVGQSLDIGVTNGGLGTLTVYRNNNGNPIPIQTLPTGPRPGSVGGDDVDNDRDIDLVVGNNGDNTVRLLRNDSGTFSDAGSVNVGEGLRTVATADLNNDGYADFVTVNEGAAGSPSSVSVVMNRTATAAPGSIEYAPAVNVPAGASPASPAIGDFDADGDFDIAYAGTRTAAAGGQRVVMVLRNDGSSAGVLQLSPGDDVATAQAPNIVLAANMDGDLATDIVALGQATAFAAGTPTYTANVLPSTAGAGNCPADLTGDGLVDGADLATLLVSWGTSTTGDLTGDGQVDGADLATLLGVWGPCGQQ